MTKIVAHLLCATLCSIILSGSAAVAQSAGKSLNQSSIAVYAVRSDIVRDTKIGLLKAGLACFPNGTLRWPGLSNADTALLAETANQTLSLRSVNTVADDNPAFPATADNATYRMIGDIKTVHMSLCARRWGLGNRSQYSGKADATVIWTVYKRGQREPVKLIPSAVDVKAGGKGFEDIDGVITALVVASAAQIAPLLAEGGF